MAHTRLEFTKDHSSTIASIQHNGNELHVTFRPYKEGLEPAHYHYSNVTPEMFAELKAWTASGKSPKTWLDEHGVIVRKGQPTNHPYNPIGAHEVWK